MALFLTCGALTSSGCTVGEYVIEWKLDDPITGSTAFVSASANPTDTDINKRHPFADEVVQSGTLHPVIRYCELDGQLYSADPMAGAIISDDFKTCLPSITIDPINCSTEFNSTYNSGTTSGYRYNMEYSRTIDGANKSRSFKYFFDTTTYYISFFLDSDVYADQLKIYYCTPTNPTGTLIENFVNGDILLDPNATTSNTITLPFSNDFTPSNYPQTPKQVVNYDVLNVIDLNWCATEYGFTRTNNDYFIVEVIGSYLATGFDNTIWNLGLQCHNTPIGQLPNNLIKRQIDKTSLSPNNLIYNTGTCKYTLTYTNIDNYEYFPLYNYMGWSHNFSNTTKNKSIEISLVPTYSTSLTQNIAPIINDINYLYVEKTSTFLRLHFDNNSLSAYDSVVNVISGATNTLFLNYSSDSTSINYYMFLMLEFYDNITGCTDGASKNYVYIHPSSFPSINYNYTNPTGKTIHIPLTTINLGITSTTCDGGKYSAANGSVNTYNTYKSQTKSYFSNCINNLIEWKTRKISITNPIIYNEDYRRVSLEKYCNDIYGLKNNNAQNNTIGINELTTRYYVYTSYDKLTITADLTNYDSSVQAEIDNVLDNWKLERKKPIRDGIINVGTDYSSTPYELVYEVVNGVGSFGPNYQ